MALRIASKLPDVGVTIFSQMTRLADTHHAINLSQGFPDFQVAPDLIEAVHRHMCAGANQYAPMEGVPALRRRIAEKVSGLYGGRYDPEREITVTSGATEAIFAAIAAVVGNGDRVLVVEPAYDAYLPMIRLNGGRPVFVSLRPPDYAMDWDAVRRAMAQGIRLIILNSPHNPTGAVLDENDIAELRRLVDGTDSLILSDEVYEHIVFDGRTHLSMARYPDLAERSFVVSSFGKTYHATGWKVGYCLAPAPLSDEFRRVHQFLTFSTHTPTQLALADFMSRTEAYQGLASFYQKKRDRFLALLAGSRFVPIPCAGTYFQMLDFSRITDEPDVPFARRLTVEHGVASIPPSVFYRDLDDHKVLRFCFAKRDDTLREAAARLCRI